MDVDCIGFVQSNTQAAHGLWNSKCATHTTLLVGMVRISNAGASVNEHAPTMMEAFVGRVTLPEVGGVLLPLCVGITGKQPSSIDAKIIILPTHHTDASCHHCRLVLLCGQDSSLPEDWLGHGIWPVRVFGRSGVCFTLQNFKLQTLTDLCRCILCIFFALFFRIVLFQPCIIVGRCD